MRIVHYLNQFFAQVGGETAADFPLTMKEEAVGPGKPLEMLLEGKAEIVATIICGDNYFVENADKLSEKIRVLLDQYQADLVIAGPAFNAGRYGMACGAVCKMAQEKGIPAISAMYEGNPGLGLYKQYAYIFPTVESARGMKKALEIIATFTMKLAAGEELKGAKAEGYFPRGIRKNIFKEKTGAQRAVDMILNKVQGQSYETELPMPNFVKVAPSAPIKDVKKATIAVMTTGGIVPKGNPDQFESCFATKYTKYSPADLGGLGLINCEVAHGGYDPTFGNSDPNRVLPVDAMKQMQDEGEIGGLYDWFYVTVGNGMDVGQASRFGQAIAAELVQEGKVDGVILTST